MNTAPTTLVASSREFPGGSRSSAAPQEAFRHGRSRISAPHPRSARNPYSGRQFGAVAIPEPSERRIPGSGLGRPVEPIPPGLDPQILPRTRFFWTKHTRGRWSCSHKALRMSKQIFLVAGVALIVTGCAGGRRASDDCGAIRYRSTAGYPGPLRNGPSTGREWQADLSRAALETGAILAVATELCELNEREIMAQADRTFRLPRDFACHVRDTGKAPYYCFVAPRGARLTPPPEPEHLPEPIPMEAWEELCRQLDEAWADTAPDPCHKGTSCLIYLYPRARDRHKPLTLAFWSLAGTDSVEVYCVGVLPLFE